MDVKVSRKNIKYGRREQEKSCPIALAIKGMGFKHVAVRDYMVTLMKDKMCYEYLPSDRAASFIERFDDYVDKKHFRPTTFRFKLRRKFTTDEARREGNEWWAS